METYLFKLFELKLLFAYSQLFLFERSNLEVSFYLIFLNLYNFGGIYWLVYQMKELSLLFRPQIYSSKSLELSMVVDTSPNRVLPGDSLIILGLLNLYFSIPLYLVWDWIGVGFEQSGQRFFVRILLSRMYFLIHLQW